MMYNTNKHNFLLVAALLLIGLLTGCLKDDLSNCPSPFQVSIKAFDADRNDITEMGDVQQVALFVFDEDDIIYQTFELSAEDVAQRKLCNLFIKHPVSKKFRIIALGNLDRNVDYSNINDVNDLSDLYVKLKSRESRMSGRNIAHPPGDLFGGEINVTTAFKGKDGEQVHVVEMERLTVGITITAIDLKKWNGNKEGDYSFLISETYNMLGLDWTMMGEQVSYAPLCNFEENINLTAPIFYAFPTIDECGYILEIVYNGEVIFTADKDTNGVEFICDRGRTLNIIIDFRSNIKITTQITPWDAVFQDVDFN